MSKKVFFPQYAKAGFVEVLTDYSIGDKNYKVYLVTIDDMNKFVHDEREKGRLKFVTMEEAINTEKEIDRQISQLTMQINELKKLKEQKQYIATVLQENNLGGIKPVRPQKNPNGEHHHCNCHHQQHHKQPHLQTKKPELKPQAKESFVIKTPLGYVADVDKEGVTFTGCKCKAKTFNKEGEAFGLGKSVFQNQLPFIVEDIDPSEKEHHLHEALQPKREDFMLNLLKQISSGIKPGKMSVNDLKKLFPNADIKAISIDKDGNMREL